MEYASIFHAKALQRIDKLGFLVWKYTFWQPWYSNQKWVQIRRYFAIEWHKKNNWTRKSETIRITTSLHRNLNVSP
jgi:hypothetical protein